MGTATFTQSLVPEDVKPEACRRLGCEMDLRPPGVLTDSDGDIVFSVVKTACGFVHSHDGRHDVFQIPMAWLEDVDKDLWAEIRPWLESLHETAR